MNKKTGTGSVEFSKKGGAAFKEKYGEKGFKAISSKRWDRHYGRICLNCDLTRKEIEEKNLPCEIKIVIVEKFAQHEFNDPSKGRPPARHPGKNRNRSKKNK